MAYESMVMDFDATLMEIAVRNIRYHLEHCDVAVCLLNESHYDFPVIDPVQGKSDLTRHCRLVVPDNKETAGNWVRLSDLPVAECYEMLYIDNYLFVKPLLPDEDGMY